MPALQNMEHKGWNSRGYIPHFDAPGLVQAITLRLHDSLPAIAVERLAAAGGEERDAAHRARVERYLNAGYGACYLQQAPIAALVEHALYHFDGERYRLVAWVIMPNHVHVIIEMQEGHPLAKVVHSWKSYTAKAANELLGREGPFWFREYFDRYIRDGGHLARAIAYVHENPVKAGLVECAAAWPYSSARWSAGVPPAES